ncbi:hypothetical protein ACFJIW_05795 [Tahibacter sp. UC22_41]|uniref:hypothetical protein n=1 Tax=Tahibacter sp. UC22_41 TaxID=3350178 RepID=UPI0036DF8B04
MIAVAELLRLATMAIMNAADFFLRHPFLNDAIHLYNLQQTHHPSPIGDGATGEVRNTASHDGRDGAPGSTWANFVRGGRSLPRAAAPLPPPQQRG